MLTQTIAEIKAETARTMVASKKPLKWDTNTMHPLACWVLGNRDVREYILNSPHICGIAFITNTNLPRGAVNL
jgi:hypothetical protein